MKINYNSIKKFHDFAIELDINNIIYDLHNDFVCISLEQNSILNTLTIIFKERVSELLINFIFNDVEITKFKFLPIFEELIIDQIYLGNSMDDNAEINIIAKDKGYFYISFLPDFDIELLAESITIHNV